MFHSRTQAMIQDTTWIRREVEKRRSMKREINTALSDLALRHRGIENFSDKVEAWMPSSDTLCLCLGRQVASVSLEHLCLELLASWLAPEIDCRAEIIEFKQDNLAFHNANPYKQSITTLQVLTRVRSGIAMTRSLKVVPKDKRHALGRGLTFTSIPAQLRRKEWNVDFIGTIPELHKQLRIAANVPNGSSYDVSHFWSDCVRSSIKPPSSVYVETKDGRIERRNVIPEDAHLYVRPPASWCYLLYLSLFLDGSRALVATTIEEDDENIRTFFLECIELLERETGFSPLIVWLPHCSERIRRESGKPCEFTEINPSVFQKGWLDLINIPPCNSAYEAGNDFLHQLAMLPIPE